jgi:Tfp pilus assembly protein FimV
MAIAPLPDLELLDALTATRPPLRLLSFPGDGVGADDQVVAQPRPSRVVAGRERLRIRRTVVAVVAAGLLAGLALPVRDLAGTNPNPAIRAGATYVVRPGDTLDSIAQRLGPPADQHSLVAEMASETGSHTVVAGEHIVLP